MGFLCSGFCYHHLRPCGVTCHMGSHKGRAESASQAAEAMVCQLTASRPSDGRGSTANLTRYMAEPT